MMFVIIYILIAIGIIIAAMAIWIKASLWIMGLGIDDDGRICWPWRKDD